MRLIASHVAGRGSTVLPGPLWPFPMRRRLPWQVRRAPDCLPRQPARPQTGDLVDQAVLLPAGAASGTDSRHFCRGSRHKRPAGREFCRAVGNISSLVGRGLGDVPASAVSATASALSSGFHWLHFGWHAAAKGRCAVRMMASSSDIWSSSRSGCATRRGSSRGGVLPLDRNARRALVGTKAGT